MFNVEHDHVDLDTYLKSHHRTSVFTQCADTLIFVPDLDRAVTGTTDNTSPIAGGANCMNLLRVSQQRPLELACFDIPQLDLGVATPNGYGASLRVPT